MNWGINSMSVNNRVILNINKIIVDRWTTPRSISSESIWRDKRSDEGWKLNKNQEFKENTLATSGGEMEIFTSPAILEVSVISTEINSFWGSADEGSIGAESNAWDNSSAPKTDWDAMVDNCEKRGLEVEHQLEKDMDCLPGQLMVLFYEVFSQ